MAISLGTTKSNSGNKTTASSFSFNHTTDANTKALVVVVTGMDSSDTDSAVSSITFGGILLTHPVTRYRNGSVFIDIWYLPKPQIGSTIAVAVTMGGTCTDVQATAVNLIDSAAVAIVYNNNDTGTGSGSASGIVNPAKTGSYAVGGGVAQGGTPASLSVTTGTEVTGSEVDMGSQTASVGTVAESGGTATITWTYAAVTCDAFVATFYSQFSPTVALNTPTDAATGQSTNPDLVFTGTDSNVDTIEYNVQVDTVNTFNSRTTADTVVAGGTYKPSIVTSNRVVGGVSTTVNLTQASGESFSLASQIIAIGIKLYLTRINSPVDSLKVEIHTTSVTGPVIASGTLSISGISTGENTINFLYPVVLAASTTYYLTITRTPDIQDTVNYINVGGAGTGGTFTQGKFQYKYNNSWLEDAGDDIYFVLIEGGPKLVKFSVTPDATFTDVTNGAHTHPFPSTEQIKYTIQVDDTLTGGVTYYWRVAAIDPSGSNTYGAWSSIFSFTPTAAERRVFITHT